MKRFGFVFVVCIALLLLVGCGKETTAETPTNTTSDVYLNLANDYIEKEDYDAAIDILQKGIDSTGSDELSEKLKEVVEMQLKNSDKDNIDEDIIQEAPEEQVSEIEFSWLDMSGDYVSDEYGLSLYFGYDELSESYIVAFGEMLIEDLVVDENSCYGMVYNAQITFTYDNSTEKLTYNYFDYTSRYSENVVLSKSKSYTRKQAQDYINELKTLYYNNDTTDDYYVYDDEYNYDYDYDYDYEEDTNVSDTNSGYIQYGDIRYDDISSLLPVSLDQLTIDINNNDICARYYNSPAKLISFLPIKCEYYESSYSYECTIYCRGYFEYDDIIADNKFYLKYGYNDIGGWVYKSRGSNELREYSAANPPEYYGVDGQKNGNFGYDNYPSGSPLSLGEIADDILYARLNCLYKDNDWHVFDIDSLSVLKGNYWENDYANYLDLAVKATLSNESYDAVVEYDLTYRWYEAGGWELTCDYHSDDDAYNDSRIEDKDITPKTVTYNDQEFIKNMKDIFSTIKAVDVQDSTDSQGRLQRVTTYDAVRSSTYLKEYYDVVNIAVYNGYSWNVNVSINLREVDYSALIGVWEANLNGEILRVNITDMKMTGDSSGIIEYDYSSTPWMGEGSYTEDQIISRGEGTEELSIYSGRCYYTLYDTTNIICHNNPIVNLTLEVGVKDYASLCIYKEKVCISYYKINNIMYNEEVNLKKIS